MTDGSLIQVPLGLLNEYFKASMKPRPANYGRRSPMFSYSNSPKLSHPALPEDSCAPNR
uniref:Uncharacterized protein n=1 Tax=Peronospora matthiolae TaxID=2874970 RepID=A0AAV1V466_9STRA